LAHKFDEMIRDEIRFDRGDAESEDAVDLIEGFNQIGE
jgi:hypothetical protein